MSQTNVIAAVVMLAFVMFVTARGKLPKYAAVVFGNPQSKAPANEKEAAAKETGDKVDEAAKKATRIAGGLSKLNTVLEGFA